MGREATGSQGQKAGRLTGDQAEQADKEQVGLYTGRQSESTCGKVLIG